jgi:hypothetical protein
MSRERALKVVLVVVGLIFSGLVYPLTMFVRQEPALAMMLSLYVTLGIFLLLAARNPSANRSLIAFGCCLSAPQPGQLRNRPTATFGEVSNFRQLGLTDSQRFPEGQEMLRWHGFVGVIASNPFEIPPPPRLPLTCPIFSPKISAQ